MAERAGGSDEVAVGGDEHGVFRFDALIRGEVHGVVAAKCEHCGKSSGPFGDGLTQLERFDLGKETTQDVERPRHSSGAEPAISARAGDRCVRFGCEER